MAQEIDCQQYAGLKIGDLDLKGKSVLLRVVKNRNQQIVPLSKSLIVILSEYLTYRNGSENDYLFCNQYGRKLTKSGIESAIRRYNYKRGVLKTSIHLYRHFFAKHWLMNDGDTIRLQTLLGHQDMAMVKQYAAIYGQDLQRGFNEHNPLERYTNLGKQSIKMGRQD